VPMFFKLMTDRHLTEKRSTREIKDEISHAQKKSHLTSLPPHHAPHTDR
jgi:hypothetical protein